MVYTPSLRDGIGLDLQPSLVIVWRPAVHVECGPICFKTRLGFCLMTSHVLRGFGRVADLFQSRTCGSEAREPKRNLPGP